MWLSGGKPSTNRFKTSGDVRGSVGSLSCIPKPSRPYLSFLEAFAADFTTVPGSAASKSASSKYQCPARAAIPKICSEAMRIWRDVSQARRQTYIFESALKRLRTSLQEAPDGAVCNVIPGGTNYRVAGATIEAVSFRLASATQRPASTGGYAQMKPFFLQICALQHLKRNTNFAPQNIRR